MCLWSPGGQQLEVVALIYLSLIFRYVLTQAVWGGSGGGGGGGGTSYGYSRIPSAEGVS